LAMPTNLMGEPTFHSFRLIQIVNSHGKTMIASTTTSAGTTKGQYDGARKGRPGAEFASAAAGVS